jgi:hypothetical protein
MRCGIFDEENQVETLGIEKNTGGLGCQKAIEVKR